MVKKRAVKKKASKKKALHVGRNSVVSRVRPSGRPGGGRSYITTKPNKPPGTTGGNNGK